MWLDVRVYVAGLLLLVSACGGAAGPTDTSADESPPTAAAPGTTDSPTPTAPLESTASVAASTPASTSTPTAEPSVEFTGMLRTGGAQEVPDEGIVAIIWVVSAGDDYLFAHGSGTQRGDEFTVRIDGPPPAEALNNADLGVALVLLVPNDAEVPVGRLAGNEPLEDGVLDVIGAAGRYALIFRANGDADTGWVEAFPPGYSCGQGVATPDPQDFDMFEPVDCSTLVLDIGDLESIEFVNWT